MRLHSMPYNVVLCVWRRVQLGAREMADGRVCLQLRLSSQLPWPAMLTQATLVLQGAFILDCDLAKAAGLLPCRVC